MSVRVGRCDDCKIVYAVVDPAETIAALSGAFGDESFSECSCFRPGHAIYCLNPAPRNCVQGCRARVTKLPIDDNSASTAILSATAEANAFQAQNISEREN